MFKGFGFFIGGQVVLSDFVTCLLARPIPNSLSSFNSVPVPAVFVIESGPPAGGSGDRRFSV